MIPTVLCDVICVDLHYALMYVLTSSLLYLKLIGFAAENIVMHIYKKKAYHLSCTTVTDSAVQYVTARQLT